MADELVLLFEKIGLTPEKAVETAGNKKLAPVLEKAIQSSNAIDLDIDKSTGALLYQLASTIKGNSVNHLEYISKAITDKRLLTSDQVSAAIKYTNNAKLKNIADQDFDESCGVGIVITPEEIRHAVASVINEKRSDLESKRYSMIGLILGAAKQKLKWANALDVKEQVDQQILALLGPKDDRDDPKKQKKKTETTSNAPTPLAKAASQSSLGNMADRAKSSKFVFEGELARLHKPGGNPQIKEQLMIDHLKRTGGKVITRFPPEPNGFLHIGHAKAININFGYAAAHGGTTNLRYDDTNPEAEEQIYFDSILETVRWLGYEPHQITYSSDHFQRLYDLAVELIKKDKAYVCHCTAEEMHAHRGGDAKGPRTESVYRNRPISESLEEFQKMKDGKYKEGEATLRMKMDMQHPNPQFWDLVAYRVMFSHHFRSKDEWCIYPTYDFTHCLCDSFEDITHSLCTTEFVLNRESYYWLVDALEIYKPVQWEYGRLKLTNTVLSKRKLMKLVDEKIVSGWDDPRLFTLQAVRRRGFTPEAINAFVRELGVTTVNSTIPVERLENYVRDHLNEVAGRLMVILEPLKITIENLPDNHLEEIQVPNHPKNSDMGVRVVPFTKTVYIDASDFREESDPNFYRLSPGKSVGLLHVDYPITATNIIKDASGKVIEVKARYEKGTEFKKPKTYIQWVGESSRHQSPVQVEVRVYSNLFVHADPENKDQVPGGWLSDINPDSLNVIPNAMADVGVKAAKVEDKFQFLRMGYFCVDQDSKVDQGKFVFNRTVTLKEDSKKDK